jgi:rubrerythrin
MFNFFKKKESPYKYKMLCKNCDIIFESENPRSAVCPVCNQFRRVETYAIINKETGQEIR